MIEIKNVTLQKFVDVINAKDWNKALEINKTIKENELKSYEDKSVYRIGLALMYYFCNSNTISDNVIDSFLHDEVISKREKDISDYFPEIDWFNIYIDCLLHKSRSIEQEGDIKEAFYLLDDVFFSRYIIDKKFAPLYNRKILLMFKMDSVRILPAILTMQEHGIPLSKEVTDVIGNPDDIIEYYRKMFASMNDYVLRKEGVVFQNDVIINQHFNVNFIYYLFPELKAIKKWIFKKSLTINGDLLPSSIKIEVRGNTKISGNLIQSTTRTGAAMLFKGNLDVDGYIKAGGVIIEGGAPLRFTTKGELKASFISTNSKVSIKGTIAPETLIIIFGKKENIEGYNCHYRSEIKRDYWTEETIKDWERFGGSLIWLDYDKILEALKKGENIFLS